MHNLGKPPRMLVLLHLDGSVERPSTGDAVLAGGRTVGRLGTVVEHVDLGPIALALLKRGLPADTELATGPGGPSRRGDRRRLPASRPTRSARDGWPSNGCAGGSVTSLISRPPQRAGGADAQPRSTVNCRQDNKRHQEIGAAYSLGRSVIARGGPPMGRGRAKAKQTKVARELKYSSPQTDFQRLQHELSGTECRRLRRGWTATTAPTTHGRRGRLAPLVHPTSRADALRIGTVLVAASPGS